MRSKNKIINIDKLHEITNGTPEHLKHINPNQIGNVMSNTDENLGEITPIIMTINQNKKDKNKRLQILKDAGGDFDKKIMYYGVAKSANDILATKG